MDIFRIQSSVMFFASAFVHLVNFKRPNKLSKINKRQNLKKKYNKLKQGLHGERASFINVLIASMETKSTQ